MLLIYVQNELCRMKLDLTILDKLVHEYCVYRGIVEGVPSSPPGKISQRNFSALATLLLGYCPVMNMIEFEIIWN